MQRISFWIKQALAAGTLATALAGGAAAQSATTTITRNPGSYSRDTTVTGVHGKTATYQNNATWGNGVYNDTRSFTGVKGGTRTDNVTRSGGVVTNTVTGRNGNSRTFSHRTRFRR